MKRRREKKIKRDTFILCVKMELLFFVVFFFVFVVFFCFFMFFFCFFY